jgi:integrase
VEVETLDLPAAQQAYTLKINVGPSIDSVTKVRIVWEQFIASEGKVERKHRNRGRRGERTRDKYATNWRMDIEPVIGDLPIEKVDVHWCMKVFERAETRKTRNGKPLSANTLYSIRATMTSFFTWATKHPHKYIDLNPMKQIDSDELPSQPATSTITAASLPTYDEIDALAKLCAVPKSKKDASKIFACQLETFVLLAPEVSMRIGEVFGLRIPDFEKDAKPHGRFLVQRQINPSRKVGDPASWFVDYLKGGEDSAYGKSRYVPLSGFGREVLDRYLKRGFSEGWLQLGGLLWPTEKQTPRSPSDISNALKEAVEKLGDKRIVSHHFRHFWSSMALDQGKDFKFIAEHNGNSELVTKMVYAHRVDRSARDAEVAAVGRQAGGRKLRAV